MAGQNEEQRKVSADPSRELQSFKSLWHGCGTIFDVVQGCIYLHLNFRTAVTPEAL